MAKEDYLGNMKRLCGGKWPHGSGLSPLPILRRSRVNAGKAGMRRFEVCAHIDVLDKAGQLDMCLLDVLVIYALKQSQAWEISQKEFDAMKANTAQSGMTFSIGKMRIRNYLGETA